MNGSPEKLRLYRKLSEISINSNCCLSSMYLIWVSKRFVENCAGCDYRYKDTYSNGIETNSFHWTLTIRYILSLRLNFRCFYLLLASRFIYEVYKARKCVYCTPYSTPYSKTLVILNLNWRRRTTTVVVVVVVIVGVIAFAVRVCLYESLCQTEGLIQSVFSTWEQRCREALLYMHETKTVYKNGKHVLNEATTVITAERLTASIALPSIHCSSVHMFLVWFVVCCCVFFSVAS